MLSLHITGSSVREDRSQKAKALREFSRNVRSVAAKIYQNSAEELLQCLQKARLNEDDIPDACVTEKVFRSGHLDAVACGPSCNCLAADHLATAARCYAAAAVNSVALSDFAQAFKYYRKAARYCRAAAEMDGAGNQLEIAASQYAYRAATLRQYLAKRRILRRKLKLVIPAWFR